jgi:hypothetical protein
MSSIDEYLILKIKRALGSNHNIYEKPVRLEKFNNGAYVCKKSSVLRIGNKEMFQDLVNLGLVPRKSLRLKLPNIPNRLFRFFLRGYFDGDGCIHASKPKGGAGMEIYTIFTSGCQEFLLNLNRRISELIGLPNKNIYYNSGAFRLRFRKKDSLKLLAFMYKDLDRSIYLERKYQIYKHYLAEQN